MRFTARNEVGVRLCFYTCLWFCSRGGGSGQTLLWADTPPGQTPPGKTTPRQTPPAQNMLGYGQQAGGMHLTGMHSCWCCYFPYGWGVSQHAMGHTHPPRQTPSSGQTSPLRNACWDTVNKRAVRILLECILVYLWWLIYHIHSQT